MAFFLNLLLGVALQIVGFLLAPKPKQEKPPEAEDMDDPTAEAGRPVPVVFGTIQVKGMNLLWFGEKVRVDRLVKDKSGKKK